MTQYDAAAVPRWRCFDTVCSAFSFPLLYPSVDLSDRDVAINKWQKRSERFNFEKEDAAPDLEFNEVLWHGIKGDITITNARAIETTTGYILYFTYVAFCMSVILAFYIRYRRTGKIESMDKSVKNNLEEYVVQLEQRLKWQYFGSRLVVLLFLVLVEVLPLFYHARMLDSRIASVAR